MGTTSKSQELRSLKLAIGLYIFIFCLKLAAYLITGVVALLAEALHTLSDIFISSFLLIALIWSRKDADRVHMFGYGRAQNVAATRAATLFISFTSYKLYEEVIPRLFNNREVIYQNQNLSLALGVLIVSMLIAVVPLVSLFRQKKPGATAKAQLRELFNDELGIISALIGTLFISWGQPIADPIATLVVATVIAISATGLFRQNASFLLGRSPGQEFLARVEGLARSIPGVLDVHDLRAEYIGPETVHVGMHLSVQRGLPIEEADRVAEEVHELVQKETGCRYCVIHVDPTERVAISGA